MACPKQFWNYSFIFLTSHKCVFCGSLADKFSTPCLCCLVWDTNQLRKPTLTIGSASVMDVEELASRPLSQDPRDL